MKEKEEKKYLKQKRIIIGAAGFLLAGFLLLWQFVPGGERYSIYSQFSFGGGNYRETVMNVVVSWNASVDEVAEEIIREHIRVNAENCSDKITLRLYRSEWAMKQGICFKELFYVT